MASSLIAVVVLVVDVLAAAAFPDGFLVVTATVADVLQVSGNKINPPLPL
jgi:hypothetical protein